MKNKRRVAPFDSPLLLLSTVTVTTGCVTGGTIVVVVVIEDVIVIVIVAIPNVIVVHPGHGNRRRSTPAITSHSVSHSPSINSRPLVILFFSSCSSVN